jgi:DNA-directed RNA polymerase specialized sigma24 family protein
MMATSVGMSTVERGGGGRGVSRQRAVLHERFTEVWQEHERRVRAVIAAGRCDDPDGLVGEVARKAWEAFPVTVKRERGRIRNGWGSYNWRAWLELMAERVVIDERRRARTVRRWFGERAESRVPASGWCVVEGPEGVAGGGERRVMEVDEVMAGDNVGDVSPLGEQVGFDH